MPRGKGEEEMVEVKGRWVRGGETKRGGDEVWEREEEGLEIREGER